MALTRDIDTAGLGAILKTALDAVVVMRLDGTIAGWNDIAEQTFGWTFDEAVGRRMSDVIIPERFRQSHEDGLARYLTTGAGPVLDTHLELDALHRDGHEVPIELSITRASSAGEPVFLGFVRDITSRRAAERRQALMIGELNHRVKNLLGVVSGIAHQTIRSSPSMEQFQAAFMGRLQSLARAHEILTAATWEHASLRELARSLVGAFGDTRDQQIHINGPDLRLSPKQFLSLSMILHELVTNAVKYGALATDSGRIALTWTSADGLLSLMWREQAGSPARPPERTGFGSKMISLSVEHELRGHLTRNWTSDGLHLDLVFAMD